MGPNEFNDLNKTLSKDEKKIKMQKDLVLNSISQKHEKWKDVWVDDTKTNYLVSNQGRVLNISTIKLLKPTPDEYGYMCISIYINGKRYGKFVHQLVATAFIPNPETKLHINHKDANTSNNYDWNLEWCTPMENVHHTINLGRKKVGSDCSFSKYTDEQIHHVCKLLQENKTILIEIEKLTGVHHGVVWDIKSQKLWKHISKEYDIPLPISDRRGDNHQSSKYTEKQIHEVCKMLMDPKTSFQEITKATGIPKSGINNLVQGKSWKHISSQYKIPEREKSIRAKKILGWIGEGLSKKVILEKLMAEFDIPDQTKAKEYIKSVRGYYKTASCSTTIPNTGSLEKNHDSSKEEVHPQANGGT